LHGKRPRENSLLERERTRRYDSPGDYLRRKQLAETVSHGAEIKKQAPDMKEAVVFGNEAFGRKSAVQTCWQPRLLIWIFRHTMTLCNLKSLVQKHGLCQYKPEAQHTSLAHDSMGWGQ
jgi:hypothetical protein